MRAGPMTPRRFPPPWSNAITGHTARTSNRGISLGVRLMGPRGQQAMDSEVFGQAELDEQILTFDIPDEALERVATAEQQAVTWIYCTNSWHSCDWPQ